MLQPVNNARDEGATPTRNLLLSPTQTRDYDTYSNYQMVERVDNEMTHGADPDNACDSQVNMMSPTVGLKKKQSPADGLRQSVKNMKHGIHTKGTRQELAQIE